MKKVHLYFSYTVYSVCVFLTTPSCDQYSAVAIVSKTYCMIIDRATRGQSHLELQCDTIIINKNYTVEYQYGPIKLKTVPATNP